MAKKSKRTDTMAYDLFERQYRQQIEWQTEVILGNDIKDQDYQEAYDSAYEEAVEQVAAQEGITLL